MVSSRILDPSEWRQGCQRIGILVCLTALICAAQTTSASVATRIDQPVHSADVAGFQIRQFVVERVAKLTVPSSAAEWTRQAQSLRARALETMFHGWPKEWVDAPPHFEDAGLLPSGAGYRLRKLRYEIVPGFWTTALLYEPVPLNGKVPAILDVNGHEGTGKSVEYIQKRCINQARQGILALNLEWIGKGDSNVPENDHWFQSHLDLAGARGVGLFYLAMRRGLDYLSQHPNVDPKRMGVTGLSGGGWQTITLSALDERVYASAPNAGYLSILSMGGGELIGDNEQSPADLTTVTDYTHLTAMRAPRPTQLIFNAEDNCCFRAPRMKPFVYDAIRPFFRLYGREADFLWHENADPGDHNYQLDNRLTSYRFFTKAFGLKVVDVESPAGQDIKSDEELKVGVPEGNLTILGLAKKFASQVNRPAPNRGRLAEITRYRRVDVSHAWPIANSHRQELETISYRFDFSNRLSATGIWLRATSTPDDAPVTIVLDDAGKKTAGEVISERVNRGEQVLAVDLLLIGDAAPPKVYYPAYDRMLATAGERSVGIQAGQLSAITRWMKQKAAGAAVRIESKGMRSQLAVLIAAAQEPGLYSGVITRGGLTSLREAFDRPIKYLDAPEIFCLDLYKEFDLDSIRTLGSR